MKPKLDWFIGRPVSDINDAGGSDWSITLEGDVIIENRDDARDEEPAGIRGTSLLAVKEVDDNVILTFGHNKQDGEATVIGEITLTKDKYTIASDQYPDTGEDEYVLPPMPVREEVVEAPVTSSEATAEETEAESG